MSNPVTGIAFLAVDNASSFNDVLKLNVGSGIVILVDFCDTGGGGPTS